MCRKVCGVFRELRAIQKPSNAPPATSSRRERCWPQRDLNCAQFTLFLFKSQALTAEANAFSVSSKAHLANCPRYSGTQCSRLFVPIYLKFLDQLTENIKSANPICWMTRIACQSKPMRRT